MPQLVKGGKHVFAWSKVNERGKIIVPPEALEEYGFKDDNKCILIPGSKRSGGFGLTSKRLLKNSPIYTNLEKKTQLINFEIPECKLIAVNKKNYCWLTLENDGSFIIPLATLKYYGVEPKDNLLVVRGSGLALGFIIKGPIIEEAKAHPEIEKF